MFTKISYTSFLLSDSYYFDQGCTGWYVSEKALSKKALSLGCLIRLYRLIQRYIIKHHQIKLNLFCGPNIVIITAYYNSDNSKGRSLEFLNTLIRPDFFSKVYLHYFGLEAISCHYSLTM